jgi:hypothetical protein
MPDAITQAARIEAAAGLLEGAARSLGGCAARARELASVECEGGSMSDWGELAGRIEGIAEGLAGLTGQARALVGVQLDDAVAAVRELPPV